MATEAEPIDTTAVVLYELAPATVTVEVDGKPVALPGHKWERVAAAGSTRLTVGVRFLDPFEAREARRLDGDAHVDFINGLALKSAQAGMKVYPEPAKAIPLAHYVQLAKLVLHRSVLGADPFVEAPAASSD